MNNEADLSRLRLEERVTYCERLVDTLDEVTAHLQKRVLALEDQNRKLLSEIRRQQEAARASELPHEKPPHY